MKKGLLALSLSFFGLASSFAQNLNISGGNTFSSVLCADGNVLSWGKNNNGQFGVATPASSTTPVMANLTIGGSTVTLKSIDAGSGSHVIGQACDGTVVAWGNNADGELGTGTAGGFSTNPVRVLGGETGTQYLQNIKYVSGGNDESFAVLNTGEMVAWGANDKGQLGNGTTTSKSAPAYVKINATTRLTNVIQTDAGDANGIALTSDGSVWTWGSNDNKQLGRGTMASDSYAGKVVDAQGNPLKDIIMISGGDKHGLALDKNGNVWSWGGDWGPGQLGQGPGYQDVGYASKVVAGATDATPGAFLSNVASIAGGQAYSMAVLKSGEVVTWGANGLYGQSGIIPAGTLGTGSAVNQTGDQSTQESPAYVMLNASTKLTNVISVSDGDAWAFAQTKDNKLYGWGYNAGGELGVGNTNNQLYATPVTFAAGTCKLPDPCPVAYLGPDQKVCPTFSQVLNAGSEANSYTYQWSFNGTPIGGATSSTYTANKLGTYSVKITATNSSKCAPCPDAIDDIIFSEIPTPFDTIYNTYCGTDGTFKIKNAPGAYKWYKAATGGTAIAGEVAAGTTRSLTVPLTSATQILADSVYQLYVEDATVFYGTSGTPPCSMAAAGGEVNIDGGYTQITVFKDFKLDTVSLMLRFNDNTPGTITPVIYANIPDGNKKDSPNTNAGPVYTGPTTTITGVQNTIAEAIIPVNLTLPGSASGTKYWVGFKKTLNAPMKAATCAPGFPIKDKMTTDANTVFITDNYAYGNPKSNEFGSIFNWKMSKVTDYKCGRIPVYVKKKCPPCSKPTKVQILSSDSICQGGSKTFTANYTLGTSQKGGYYYSLFKDGVLLPGFPTTTALNSYPLVGIQPIHAGKYKLRVEDGNNGTKACYLEDSLTLRVDLPVVKGAISANQVNCGPFTPVALASTTDASGGKTGGTITYTWQSSATGAAASWANIATSNTKGYAPGNLTATTYYRRKAASGVCPAVFTDSVIVTVNAIPAIPPKPTALANPACISTTVSVTQSQPANIAYFWQTTKLGTSTAAADNANTAKTVTASGKVYVRAQNTVTGCWSVSSDSIDIVIHKTVVRGDISADQQNCGGTGAPFTPAKLTSVVPASGGNGSAPVYAWEKSTDKIVFTPATGVITGADYQPPALTATEYYRRKATSGVCPAVYSDTVTIAIGTIPADPTAIAGATPACPSTDLTVANAPAGAKYFWQGTTSLGTDNAASVEAGVGKPFKVTTSGTYYVRAQSIASGCWSLKDERIDIVINQLTPGTIGDDAAVCQGAVIPKISSKTPATGGNGNFIYQWEATTDITGVAGWTDIPGASGAAALEYTPPILTDTVLFRRKVTSGTCPNVTSIVKLTYQPLPLAAGTITGTDILCAGTTGSVYSIAAVPNATSYTWTVPAGASITAGNNTTSITVTFGTTSGDIKVTPVNACGPGASKTLPITVNPNLTPTISIVGPDSICASEVANFYIKTASDSGLTPTYEWFVNNTKKGTSKSYSDGTLVNGDKVKLTMTSSETCKTAPSVTSAEWVIKVVNKVTPKVTISPDQVCAGTAQTISTQVSGGGTAPTFDWVHNGNPAGNGSSFTTTFANGDIVSVTMTSNLGCADPKTATDTKTIVVKPVPVATGTEPVVCSGTSASIDLTSDVIGTTFTWTASASGVTGVTANGTVAAGVDKIVQTLSTSASSPLDATYTITPTANSCPGTPIIKKITINPIPDVIPTGVVDICSGSATNITLKSGVAGATFAWTGTGNGAGSNTNATIAETLSNTSTAAAATSYSIIATANNCPSNTPTVITFNVKPIPTASGSNPAICSAEKTSIALTSNVTTPGVVTTYSWMGSGSSANAGGFSTTAQSVTPIAETLTNSGNVDETVTYSVTPTSGGCPGAAVLIPVTVKPIPKLTVTGSPTPICGGNDPGISVASNVTGTTYDWSVALTAPASKVAPLSGTNVATGALPGILDNTGSSQGTAVFTMTPTANGCKGTADGITIKVNPSPDAYLISGNPSICSGTTTNLSVGTHITGMTVTLDWTVAPGTATGANPGTSAIQPTIIADKLVNSGTTDENVKYTITPSGGGCTGTPLPVTVVVKPIPVAFTSNLKKQLCNNEVTNIDLISSVSGASFAVTPTGGAGSSGTTVGAKIAQALTASAKTNVVYSVVATVNSCPSLPVKDTVTVYPIPASEAGTASPLCQGDSVTIGITGNYPEYIYKWTSTEVIPNDTLSNPKVAPNVGSPVFTVKTILREYAQCFSSDNITVVVKPEFKVTIDSVPPVCAGEPTPLVANAPSATSYTWRHGASGANITVYPMDTTRYYVVASNGACWDSTSVVVQTKNVGSPQMFAPSAFSPNGDGKNEIFKVTAEGSIAFEGKIFSRWGELFYEWTDPNVGWDGKLADGTKAQQDTYIYHVKTQNICDKKFNAPKTGTVTLIK